MFKTALKKAGEWLLAIAISIVILFVFIWFGVLITGIACIVGLVMIVASVFNKQL